MGKKSKIKVGDRISIRITEQTDKLAIEWINRQKNRSESIIKLITAFAKLEKRGDSELLHIIFDTIVNSNILEPEKNTNMSDINDGIMSDNDKVVNKGNISYYKKDKSDTISHSMSDNNTMSDIELYDEVFGTLHSDDRESKKTNSKINNTSDLLNALRTIKR